MSLCAFAQLGTTIIFLDKSSGKVHIFWEGHKFLRNLHRRFVLYSNGQIYVGDFAKFCGLLRIYELYKRNNWQIALTNKVLSEKKKWCECTWYDKVFTSLISFSSNDWTRPAEKKDNHYIHNKKKEW